MVTDHDEFDEAQRHWKAAMSALRGRGIEFDKKTPLGIMIETPSSVVLADDLAGKVGFFSIGTNDLIQYTLAADRGNRQVASPDHKWHPALWRQIATVVRAGHRQKRPVGLCGELATDPSAAPFLIGLGLESISSHPNAVPRIKSIVRSLRYADCRAAAQKLLEATGISEVKRIVEAFNRKVTG
jgi:phosphoenolpyruvate-protein kinase (PTS system EI component)